MKNKNMSHNLGSMRVIYNQKDADPRAELESIADDEGVNDLILHDIEKRLRDFRCIGVHDHSSF